MIVQPFRQSSFGGMPNPMSMSVPPETYAPTDTAPGAIPTGAPSTPFIWGAGGSRLTPAQILAKQKIAAQLSQPDYSPVSSIYQGLGRVVDNVHGALEERGLRKASAANAAHDQIVASLLASGGTGAGTSAVAAALADPYLSDSTHQLAGKVFDVQNRKPAEPHYWETNDGSLGMIGADGKPTIAYKDPTPKVTTLAVDNGDGTKTLYRVGPDGVPLGAGVQGAGGATAAPAPPTVGTVEDGHRFIGGDPAVESNWQPVESAGGAAPSGTATFR